MRLTVVAGLAMLGFWAGVVQAQYCSIVNVTGYVVTNSSYASCASGWTGSATASCAASWQDGDWASVVGADAYDPDGNGENALLAQSTHITTYNGAAVTQATCVPAASNYGQNDDGEYPNGATWREER